MHIADFEVGMLGANGVVGGGYNLAAGAALANSKILHNQKVSVVFFGDGASNRGTFHESLNMAAEMDLPVIYVLENNFYAISGSQRELTKLTYLSERAKAYGMPGETVQLRRR